MKLRVEEVSVAFSGGNVRHDATASFRVARVVGDRRAVIRQVNVEKVAAKFVEAARGFFFFGGEIFAVRIELADDEVVVDRLKKRERDVRVRRDVDDEPVGFERVGARFEEAKIAVDEKNAAILQLFELRGVFRRRDRAFAPFVR